jgi:hypothetical protein
LPQSGEVDTDTWSRLMGEDPPSIRERSLQLTAQFEGHDFTLAQGNFDGAGITWGIIGFTLQSGELAEIILEVERRSPELLEQAFGSLAQELCETMKRRWPAQLAFADGISRGRDKTRLAEPWLTSFQRFGQIPAVQTLQLERAERSYYVPARATAATWGLASELGIALALDVHVQNGGIGPATSRRIRTALDGRSARNEAQLRNVIANAVADSAREKWREDVRARKLAIANGTGKVHGRKYDLRAWGLQDLPAPA